MCQKLILIWCFAKYIIFILAGSGNINIQALVGEVDQEIRTQTGIMQDFDVQTGHRLDVEQ